MKDISVLGIDLAKLVFHVVGMNSRGKVVLRRRVYRGDLREFVLTVDKRTVIGMESCSSANYWGRQFQTLGYRVRLVAPQFVKPYVKSNKNDTVDAEAIAEAVSRPTMRFVALKSVAQQDIQCLHRARERLVKTRTALVNEMRGLLGEYGIVLPKTISKFRMAFVEKLDGSDNDLTSLSRKMFWELYDEFLQLEKRISQFEKRLLAIAKAHPECRRLQTIPGIGPLTATALLAAVGDVSCFKNGRQFAAWLGLVPRQHSTGGKSNLLGISKRGDVYLRKLLVHGARTTLRWVEGKDDRRSQWASKLKERRGANRTAVALANKNARAAWVVLSRQEEYKTYAVAA